MFSSGPRLHDGIDGDPRRQAVASLRGYAYQLYATSLAWVGLNAGEQLYLEVAEDYAVLSQGALRAVQVRDTAGSEALTLRSASVAKTIESFVDLRRRNPGKPVTIRYLTTSYVSVERAVSDRPEGVAGLTYWRQAAAGADVAPLRAILERLDLSAAAAEFIAEHDDEALRAELLRQIHWDGGAADIAALRKELEAAVHFLGQRDAGGLTTAEVQLVTAEILDAVLGTIVTGNPRVLARIDLVAILERITHVSVRRRDLEALMQSSTAQTDFARSLPWRREDETLLPILLAPRNEAVAKLADRARKTGLAFAVGATGMGKSLLARLAARSLRGDWMIADFADLDPEQSADRLQSLIGALAVTQCAGVILDDLNATGSRQVATRLAQLRTALARRDRLALITAYRAPDARLRSELSISPESVQEVLDLSELEVSALVRSAGGDTTRWTRAIFLATASGHPQLTQATIADLQSRGWPGEALDRLYALDWSELDLAAQRAAARRRLVETAPEAARALLNRLSLLIGSFRRPVALELAELLPEIGAASEHLDALTGPWIDIVGTDRLRLSPLLSDAGTSSLTQTAQLKVHAAAADILLLGPTLDVQDASAGFVHALLARSAEPLQRLALSVIAASADTRSRLASWFSGLQSLRTDRPIFPESPALSRLLRLAQVLLVGASEDATGLTEKWDALKSEISQERDKDARVKFEQLAYAKVLLERRMAETPAWVSDLIYFEDLLKTIPRISDFESEVIDPIGFYFTNLSLGLRSVAALNACFSQLDALPTDSRDIVLARLSERPEEITHTINHPWVAERKDGEIDGVSSAETYAQLAAQAANWGHTELAVRCHVVRSVMLDEYVDDEAGAIAALNAAEQELGPHPAISRARAKIAFRRKRHGDSLSLLREVMRSGHRQDAVEAIFLCREAAISATELGAQVEARDWFRQALATAREVKSESLHVMAVGLQADVALAEMRCGATQSALRDLWASLEAARSIDQGSSLKTIYLYKVLGHACLWLNSQITKEAYPIEPLAPPGMCSNPEPSEEIRTLPPVSLEGGHYLLAAADVHTGSVLGLDADLQKILGSRHIFTLETQRRLGRLERAVKTLDFTALRICIEEGVEAMCLGIEQMGAERLPGDILPLVDSPFPRLSEEARLGETAQRFVNEIFFALELLIDLRGDSSLNSEIASIAARVVEDGFAPPSYMGDKSTRQGIYRDIWVRARGASPLLAEDLFATGLRMLEWSSTSIFARGVLPDLGRWALGAWPQVLSTQRFRLKYPAMTVPAIEAAIAADVPDIDRLPAILSAARMAFNFNLTDEIVALLNPRLALVGTSAA